MKKSTKLYLAYGSNLNLKQMYGRCPGAVLRGTSVLPGWHATFRGNYRGVGVMNIEPGEWCMGPVPVALFTITPEDERALDRYEGFPRLYKKIDIQVQLNGKPVTAMAYVMCDGFSLDDPSVGYYETIYRGYRDCGLDVSYFESAVHQNHLNVLQEMFRKR